MDDLSQYGHAIVALAGTAVIGLVMSPLAALRKQKLGLAPGANPEQDYGLATYRWHRAYLNLSETIGFFVAVTAAAIFAGVSPTGVNWLASIFFISRIVLVVVHVKGIGKPNMGARSFTYVAGWLCCLLLGLLAIGKAF